MEMEQWSCADCGMRIPVSEKKCPSCGYEMTDYDLAGAAEDTGQYLISRISIPELKLQIGLSMFKILVAAVIGVGIGIGLIFLLKLIFK